MAKALVLSCAITIGALPLASLPSHGQTPAPFDHRAAWFADLPDDQRDIVINEVRAHYHDRIEQWRRLSSDQKRAIVDGLRAQRLEREQYRERAWQDWRKDRPKDRPQARQAGRCRMIGCDG